MTRAAGKRVWCSERFSAVFGPGALDVEPEVAKKRRVLDFFLLPGRVQAKIQDENGKLRRAEVLVRQLTEGEWNVVFAELAKQSYFLASFLFGHVPEEVDSVLGESGITLVPSSLDEVEIVVDNERVDDPRGSVAALVVSRLCERLDEDPFALLLMRGKGREESLLETRRHRDRYERPSRESEELLAEEMLAYAGDDVTGQDFYRMSPRLKELSYNLRADELPASILKRLDPLPLSGLEDDLEQILEDAYAQVARRAQVYGLDFRELPSTEKNGEKNGEG